MIESLRSEVRKFIIDQFLYGQDGDTLKDDASFLDSGIVDSTGLLEIVSFVEGTYEVKIADQELVPDNLASVDNIVAFVERKTSGK